MSEMEEEAADVICELENVQGLVDALNAVRWKRHQDAVLELSEHGIVLIVEESGCLQAKVYLKKELFIRYDYNAEGRPRFGVSLGLFVDCLNAFSVPGHSSLIQIQYPGPDMQVLLKYVIANLKLILILVCLGFFNPLGLVRWYWLGTWECAPP
ncbi:cell cycle checkpoint protein rad1-like [Trifolium pratense]|uniref:Cell cycle checkpoint protein rad1-like n=1 Tax=Trifolium pratense TaxID=57577 RepID=A0A2K3K1Y3_TRIPR|nr:cell cycle checkpoint protein rad1-like [Trifolium pratense]